MNFDWRVAALAGSVIGLVVLIPWAASTFLVAEPVLPFWLLLVFVVGLFPIHARTVFGLIRRSGRSSLSRARWSEVRGSELISGIPRELIILGAGLFVAGWASAMTALWTLRNGGPDVSHGRFYANNHGSLTPLAEGEYHHLQLA
jgi:hypothetical protein